MPSGPPSRRGQGAGRGEESPRPQAHEAEAGHASGLLRVGTWNMSHWTVPKLGLLRAELAVDIVALQETHLASVPLE